MIGPLAKLGPRKSTAEKFLVYIVTIIRLASGPILSLTSCGMQILLYSFEPLTYNTCTGGPRYLWTWYSRFWIFADHNTGENHELQGIYYEFKPKMLVLVFGDGNFFGTKPHRIARETFWCLFYRFVNLSLANQINFDGLCLYVFTCVDPVKWS